MSARWNRRVGRDPVILSARAETYETVKRKHPDRWRNRDVRNWTSVGNVYLNPDKPVAE